MKRLKVLLLITNLGKGGAQRVFHDHAIAFSAIHDVEEAVFDKGHDLRIYNTGLPLHDLKRNDLISIFGSIGRLLSRVLALRRLVKERKYDVVISHMDGANWVNVLSGSNAKKIAVVHGSVLFDQGQSGLRKWFRLNVIPRLIYDRAAITVSVSDDLNRELRTACGISDVRTIKNFFEIDQISKFAAMSLDEYSDLIFSSGNVLITSGRLSQQKRQAALLKIMAALKSKEVLCRLVVLGDGELRHALLDEADQLGLKVFHVWDVLLKESNDYDVYFLGYVSNPYKYLARSTLFLFPSAWEGFPLSLCEAIISGVPVLSSDCPTGPREILAPGTINSAYNLRQQEVAQNGVLLPMLESTDDLQVWINAIENLLDDPVLREQLAKCGYKAIQALDRSAVISQWYQLIESVCDAS